MMKKTIATWKVFSVTLMLTGVLFSGCTPKEKVISSFKSDFDAVKGSQWIGPEYWANPLQDWQLSNGTLECVVSKKNRNVHLLTNRLDTVQGGLFMKVDVQLLSGEALVSNKNWVGFSIGSKGQFNDYRDNAIFGKGLHLGVSTNGVLFINELPEEGAANVEIQKLVQKGARLEVAVEPEEAAYSISLKLVDTKTNEVIETRSEIVATDKLVGDLVLVSHFNTNRNDPEGSKKSVAFKNWELSGTKMKSCDSCTYGPIMFSQYTMSKGTIKITAQMAPVLLTDEKVHLQLKENNTWTSIDQVAIDSDARTATFKLDQYDTSQDIPYRIKYTMTERKDDPKDYYWEGTFRKDPVNKESLVVAGFTGNSDLGFPNTDITDQIKFHDPDLLFFSGDQIYESVGGYGVQRFPTNVAMIDYLRKWYIYGWAYRDLMKDRPTISITDDHDVYHGNIWGEGGKHSPTKTRGGSKGQDAGGYMMPAEWVRMVERTQTSHLPDPFDPTAVQQGIGVYYTDMVYGGVSMAILEDRKFKSAPKALLPKAEIKNGWALNKDFDMAKDGDVAGASLLGDRQMKFLNHWVSDWGYQSQMKLLLSQTIFANVATLPKQELSGSVISKLKIMTKGEYPPNDRPVADLDSNGWPQSGRNDAVATIRKGFAFHLAGDQHLGSTVQYGVDEWNDSGFALCVPSISNYWPRRWYPEFEGQNRDPHKPRYTGDYKDGFGNKMTVHAVSNPHFTGIKPSRLYDRATGYGIVRLNKKTRNITLECWPRLAKPALGNEEQYEGWPIQITQESNYGRKAKAYLPEITVEGLSMPVIQILNATTEELIYSLRINEQTYTPKVFDKEATYTIKVGEPDTNTWKILEGVKPGDKPIQLSF